MTIFFFSHEQLAELFGYASIACWIVVFTPQIYENYTRKNTDGVSIPFLLFWIFGDIFNLIGALLEHLMLTVLLLAFYYLFADSVLMGQVLYYRYASGSPYNMLDYFTCSKDYSHSNHKNNPSNNNSSNGNHSNNINSNNGNNINKNHTSCLMNDETVYDTTLPNESSPLLNRTPSSDSSSHTMLTHPKQSEHTKWVVRLFFILSILLWVLLLLGSALFFFWPWAKDKVDLSQWHWVSQSMGWASAILYCTSRIPQIMQNFRNESVEGLSLTMFVFSVVGNITYCLSIFLKSTDRTYLLLNYPWLLGSGGTLFFDFTIFFQFYTYKQHRKSSTLTP